MFKNSSLFLAITSEETPAPGVSKENDIMPQATHPLLKRDSESNNSELPTIKINECRIKQIVTKTDEKFLDWIVTYTDVQNRKLSRKGGFFQKL